MSGYGSSDEPDTNSFGGGRCTGVVSASAVLERRGRTAIYGASAGVGGRGEGAENSDGADLPCGTAGVFSLSSGYVRTMEGVEIRADVRFEKRSHSALVGSGLDVWLVQQGIGRLIVCGIRSEQCCETTTRHASDLGYEVDYVTEATLTWEMTDRSGKVWSADEIKARTELVLDGRFATVVTVEEALLRAEDAAKAGVAA